MGDINGAIRSSLQGCDRGKELKRRENTFAFCLKDHYIPVRISFHGVSAKLHALIKDRAL
jgi:hypothetical protein